MHGYKARAFHSDSTYLTFMISAFTEPYSGSTGHSLASQAIAVYSADYGLFQQVDIVFHAKMMPEQGDYRICHKLSRPVIGDVASTFDLNKLNATAAQCIC